MTKSILAFALAIVLGLGSTAFALEGLDGDNNPIPGYATSHQGMQP